MTRVWFQLHSIVGLGMTTFDLFVAVRASEAPAVSTWKEREERARKILEKQEEERRQKAEEWRQQVSTWNCKKIV